jgi:hypothetical protein
MVRTAKKPSDGSYGLCATRLISKILPLYKLMVIKLTALAVECLTEEHNLAGALLAGAWMAKKYINKALVGDFALLGAGMHLFSHDQFEC